MRSVAQGRSTRPKPSRRTPAPPGRCPHRGPARAATNYAETVTGNDPQFVKHCATFFGPDEPWRVRQPPTTANIRADAIRPREGVGRSNVPGSKHRSRTVSRRREYIPFPDSIPELVAAIEPADFYDQGMSKLWAIIGELHRGGSKIDHLTISDASKQPRLAVRWS